jgi:hypothetical protein
MGIDLLDVKFRIERAFRLRIRRGEEAELFADGTVAALHGFIVRRLGQRERPRCLGVPVFDRFRAAVVDLLVIPPESVTPASRLDEVIPLDGRRSSWQRLGEALDLPLPALCRPRWLYHAVHAAALTAWLLAAAALVRGRPAGDWTWLLLGLLLGTGLKYAVAYLLTVRWAVCFPASCATVKGLVKTLLRENYGLLVEREKGWHEQEVWYALREVLVEALNVDPQEVRPEAHLVRDLGAG